MNEGIYQTFQKISNVLRCLDGDFVAIKMPAENEDPYICHMFYHAINVQGYVPMI